MDVGFALGKLDGQEVGLPEGFVEGVPLGLKTPSKCLKSFLNYQVVGNHVGLADGIKDGNSEPGVLVGSVVGRPLVGNRVGRWVGR